MQFVRYGLLLVAIIGLVGSLGYIVYTPPAALPAFATLVADDLRGEEMRFDAFAGEILIADFWATWCGPCITEIPHYNAIHADYGDKGVNLIGLTVQSGTAEEVLEWMAADPSHQMNYPLVMSNDELMETFGPVFGFPTTLLIDVDGTVVKRWIGAAPKKSEQIRELLDKMLAGEPLTDEHTEDGHTH
jgi:thiol-disulfide isomerase/thioredoxin